jgi:glycine cleavage system H protein
MEGNLAVIGLTGYAAQQLSDITYVELPAIGEDLAAESVFGTVESVKAAADLVCPIDGEVVEVNDVIAENPEPIGTDPYDDGWLIKVKPTDLAQLEHLMTAEEYQVLLQDEDEEEEEAAPEEEEDLDDENLDKIV